ncbi:Rad1p [Saccharomyces cerevisiae YJM1336]|nr:Rad1p [Saccharomyces cerevisiae YJM1244]AJW18238.1 Rad1p [Saccharomyces cerevisiae YJM1336]KAJ1545074.1 ssDNA endodeoxyribonuclease [Saccharomyces cerevisiae]KOH47348.1 RAD1p Single-stranded DNA endonuclease (with Rad10p) [Saccharomyces boulardii (nom. inval.)]KQC40601.1 Single-stranded DNA endonuclease (with Rad10p) [Saccharomyces boulardii (nom. inval.)]
MSQLFYQGDSDDELQEELTRQTTQASQSSKIKNEDELDDSNHLNEVENEDSKVLDDDAVLYPLIPNEPDDIETSKPNINDIRPVDIQLTLPLPFQQKVVENSLITEDALIIMGKGLGLLDIVANLLHVLATPTSINGQLKRALVLVLNAKPIDNVRIREALEELSWFSNTGKDEGDAAVESDDELFERPFNVVTADSLSIEKRRKLYISGGILSITSRILIVDLLSGIVHPNRVTGMLVLNADSLRHNSNESFILEIYRSKNTWGFIKAFSEAPETFVMEFSPLRTKMKELRLKNVLLWPRFRVEVSSCLNATNKTSHNKVIEVKVSLTNSMSQIQFGLMECLKKCIAELSRKNPELALDWWNMENVLDINFIRSIDSVMVPNWHRISYESKQLVKDIRFLRHLLKILVTSDAVDFFGEIQLSLDANKPSVSRKYSESPWLLVDEAQLVISYAKKRIFYKNEYTLEENPKWEQLIHILHDISHERMTNHLQGPTLVACSDNLTCLELAKVLNASNRKRGVRQVLLNKLKWYRKQREETKKLVKEVQSQDTFPENATLNVSSTFSKEQVTTKRRRTRGASQVAAVEKLRNAGTNVDMEVVFEDHKLSEEIKKGSGDDLDDGQEENAANDSKIFEIQEQENEILIDDGDAEFDNGELEYVGDLPQHITTHFNKDLWAEHCNEYEYVDRQDEILISTFKSLNDNCSLQEMMPSYIIMFEPDISFIRQIEVYKAIVKDLQPKVYFMYYGESIEEQSHLTAIKREKDAFTKLIRENANLSHHFETNEDLSHYKNLAERKLKLSKLRKSNTRNAGGQQGFHNLTQDVVIVDTREFNASLPGLLYRYGIRVIPCMLTVGDYVITPDICLERKSIADLIGSLQNNRLANQCKKMLKYYAYPTLLIEFDEGQSFSLEPFSERRNYKNKDISTVHPISSKLSQDEIQLKLAKLVLRFPTLKIIWSSSPLQTVNIILELKLGREQPDPSNAVILGTNKIRSDFNSTAKGLKDGDNESKFKRLLNVPGVSKIDYFNLRKKIKSFNKLQKLSWNEINEFINDEDLTDRIYYFLRTEKEEQEQESTDENLESPGKTTDDNALHDHHNDVPEAPV